MLCILIMLTNLLFKSLHALVGSGGAIGDGRELNGHHDVGKLQQWIHSSSSRFFCVVLVVGGEMCGGGVLLLLLLIV